MVFLQGEFVDVARNRANRAPRTMIVTSFFSQGFFFGSRPSTVTAPCSQRIPCIQGNSGLSALYLLSCRNYDCLSRSQAALSSVGSSFTSARPCLRRCSYDSIVVIPTTFAQSIKQLNAGQPWSTRPFWRRCFRRN